VSIERAALVLAIAAALTIAAITVRAWNARRIHRLLNQTNALRALGLQPDGRPTLVTFSTPSCAACHQAQAPAAQAVVRQLNVRHIEVDAAAKPHVASAFGVLTVPSTAIVSQAGELKAVNQGFAPTAKLVEQIRAA
jgi:thiol-disulfide isomerase/thioredoxin